METELTINGRIEALHLEPGDIVLVTIEEPGSMKRFQSWTAAMRPQLEQAFPNHRIVILAGGIKIAAASGDELPAPMIGDPTDPEARAV